MEPKENLKSKIKEELDNSVKRISMFLQLSGSRNFLDETDVEIWDEFFQKYHELIGMIKAYKITYDESPLEDQEIEKEIIGSIYSVQGNVKNTYKALCKGMRLVRENLEERDY